MAQVTLYLPDEVAKRIKRAAKQSGQSVSSYVTSLATRELAPNKWPDSFLKVLGTWEGDFDIGPDLPPDDIEFP